MEVNIKITKTKTILTGTIYVIICHHYMGMDGDFYTNMGAYSNKEDAQKVCDKMGMQSDHVDSAYDHESWYVEELTLYA